MAGSTPEHRQGSDGMSSIGKASAVGGGVKTGVSLVLMGSDIGGLSVWSGFL